MRKFRKRTLPPECYYTPQQAMEKRNIVRDTGKVMSTNPLINKTINDIKNKH